MKKQIKMGDNIFERILPQELKKGDMYYEAGHGKLLGMIVETDPIEGSSSTYSYDMLCWTSKTVVPEGYQSQQVDNAVMKNLSTPIELYIKKIK